ncbi:MAG: PEP-CTERM sorting domain-containing protein, partial [Nitrospira sp.]|nr:PEP-CTERM sorting domain-containing protein [Nitrospira sp.]
TSLLSFSDVILGDALGISLSADLGSGSITVSGGGSVVMPEPTTLLLVGFGLVGLGIMRKTRK